MIWKFILESLKGRIINLRFDDDLVELVGSTIQILLLPVIIIIIIIIRHLDLISLYKNVILQVTGQLTYVE